MNANNMKAPNFHNINYDLQGHFNIMERFRDF